MRERLGFDIEVSHNEHLRPGASELDAVLSVSASPLATAPAELPPAAEVIIFDASATAALDHVKHAVMAAIDALPDGVAFAVLAGARMAFPVGRQLCPSTPENRAVAKAAVSIATPTGVPAAMREQLALADRLFVEHEGAVRHALLVTAGDSGESEQDLARAAEACAGHFVCDCVAVGEDSDVGGLRTVASRLGGSVELVADPERLATNLVSAVSGVMAKSVTDTAMRLWLPKGARVQLLEQVHPVHVDLTQRRGRLGYRTDAWGAERREYHLRVELEPSGPGQSVIATRARLVRPAVVGEPGEFVPLAAGLVTASWSEEIARTLPLDERVADVLGKAELAKAVRAALTARAEGNLVAANEQFSEAVRHAAEAGDTEMLNQLDRVVESDPVTGAVRLKEQPAANGMSVVPKPPKPARRRRSVVQAIESTVSTPSPRPRGRHRRAEDEILDAPWEPSADETPKPVAETVTDSVTAPVAEHRPVAESGPTAASGPVAESGSVAESGPVAAPAEAPLPRVEEPVAAPVELPSITALPNLEPLPEPASSTVDTSASSWGGWPSLPASPNGTAPRQPAASETTLLQHVGRRRKHALQTGETPRITKLISQVAAPEPQATTVLRRDPAAKPIALTPVPSPSAQPKPTQPKPTQPRSAPPNPVPPGPSAPPIIAPPTVVVPVPAASPSVGAPKVADTPTVLAPTSLTHQSAAPVSAAPAPDGAPEPPASQSPAASSPAMPNPVAPTAIAPKPAGPGPGVSGPGASNPAAHNSVADPNATTILNTADTRLVATPDTTTPDTPDPTSRNGASQNAAAHNGAAPNSAAPNGAAHNGAAPTMVAPAPWATSSHPVIPAPAMHPTHPAQASRPAIPLPAPPQLSAPLRIPNGGRSSGSWPVSPPPVTTVRTGLALAADPRKDLEPGLGVPAAQNFWFWVEIPAPQPVPGAEDSVLSVALFELPGEFAIKQDAALGQIRLGADGSSTVLRQPSIVQDGTRLCFPVTSPYTLGPARVRCNVYWRQTLVQSILVHVQITAKPVPCPNAMTSTVDYRVADPAETLGMTQVPEHSASLMLTGDGRGSQSVRLLASDGRGTLRAETALGEHQLAEEIRLARGALNRVAWASAEPWRAGLEYRYAQPPTVEQFTLDLGLLATHGRRLYQLLMSGVPEHVGAAFAKPGFVQVPLAPSSRHVLPTALIYDLPLDLGSPVLRLCADFLAAVQRGGLYGSPCFLRTCAHARQPDPSTVCPGGFWGFRHALGLPVSVGLGPSLPSTLPSGNGVGLAGGLYRGFASAEEHSAALRRMLPWRGFQLGETHEGALSELDSDPQVVYFYSHGGVDGDTPFLRVGTDSDEPLTAAEFRQRGLRWQRSRPLVFLNTSHVTGMRPERAMGLVGYFVNEALASGVIGTETTVFEELADEFGQEVLRAFVINRDAIGVAVMRARISLLAKGNPLGLAYVPFVSPSIGLAAG